ncbi:MAG: hypothetical protein EA376_13150 [Phycisphaeraceae bacterium]|nr:MAG: hypothetical protein EA376_13150 [Phycisphaeraceae bacterium]
MSTEKITPKPPANAPTPGPARRRPFIEWGTIAIVTVVAVLIWLFAEAASLVRAQQQARIAVVDPLNENAVRILSENWTGAVRLTVEGPASAVQDAPAMLAEAVRLTVGQPGVSDAEGEQVIDLRAALRATPLMLESGLTVLDVEPSTVRIHIEALVTLEDVEVTLALDGLTLAEQPTLEPSRVQVRGPRRLMEELQALPGGARVVARPGAATLEGLRPGQASRISARVGLPAPLTAPRDAALEFTPASINATLTLRSRVESVAIAAAPVQVMLVPLDADRWRVTPVEPFVRDIAITGPGDIIERFRSGELSLVAMVSLSSDDLEQQIAAKPVTSWFMSQRETGELAPLPTGVGIEANIGPVRFTIERRDANDADS